jgi:aryl-alcohol dehydrogenase-like predicted oxidoreductase
METRRLGDGLEVSAIGAGMLAWNQDYEDAPVVAALQRALDLGVTLVDTADSYGFGASERTVGKAIAGRRSEIILATKFGIVKEGGEVRFDGRPSYVREAVERSLERLGVDYLDMLYQHRQDPGVPVEETVGAMALEVERGTVRHLGLSEVGPETLRRAAAAAPIAAVQSEYSLISRDHEHGVLETCAALGIGFVAYGPLCRGFLAGEFSSLGELASDDIRHGSPRFQAENVEENLRLVTWLREFAAERDITPAQVALAWILSRGPNVVPIPGMGNLEFVDENVAAADLQLSDEDLEMLTAAFPVGAALGNRLSSGDPGTAYNSPPPTANRVGSGS